jgi:hypothetical protein
MRLHTIVEPFGPADGEAWRSYCKWRGIQFERFDSIDGMLRPKFFMPESDEDWQHVVNENFKLHYFTDLEYARKKQDEIGRGVLVGLSFDCHEENDAAFRGYDLFDVRSVISLLTNWGNDVEIINAALMPNALIRDLGTVTRIRDELIATHEMDGHVEWCEIVSIYDAG